MLRSGIGFDAFVIAITSCQPFCDGRHIPPIVSVLVFLKIAVWVVRESPSSALAGSPPALDNEGEGL
jgi:hypothetical protein